MFIVFNQPGTFPSFIAVDGTASAPLVGDGERRARPRAAAGAPPGGPSEE
jgi:hypothetical protein